MDRNKNTQAKQAPEAKLQIQVGAKIREARVRMQLSQRRLAKRLQMSPEAMSRIEAGLSSISLKRLSQIASVLNQPARQFLMDAEDQVHDEIAMLFARYSAHVPAQERPGLLKMVQGLCESRGIDINRYPVVPVEQEVQVDIEPPTEQERRYISGTLTEVQDALRTKKTSGSKDNEE